MKTGIVTLASLLLLASSAVSAEIYKCTDAQGRTRYADKPCAGNSVIITPEPAPAVSQESTDRADKMQRLLRAYEAEHEETQRAAVEQKAAQQQRSNNCARARDFQRGVTEAGRLYRTDAAGQQVDLSFEERAAAESRARAEVARWCDN